MGVAVSGKMADDEGIITGAWEPRLRVDEELEFFTELALHETERWIQVGPVSLVYR